MAIKRALHSVLGFAAATLAVAALAAPYAYIPRTNGLFVIDLQTERMVADIPLPGTPVGIGARAGTRWVYVSNGVDTVWSIDSVPQAIVATVALPAPTAIAIDPIQARAFVLTGCDPVPGPCAPAVETRVTTINSNAQAPGELRVWPGITANRIGVNTDGSRVLLSGDNRAHSVDWNFNQVASTIALPSTTGGATGTPTDVQTMYVALTQGGVHRYPANATYQAGPGTIDVVMDPQGTYLYAANAGDDTVSVIDAASGIVLTTIAVGRGPSAIDIAPNGDKVYVVNATDSTMSIISTATKAVVRTLPLPAGSIVRGRFIGGIPLFNRPSVLSGMWWNPAQSGWGMHLAHRGNVVFAAWFTYDAAGAGKWYFASACRFPPDTDTVRIANASCEGDLYETVGPPRFFRDPFDPSLVRASVVGGVRIDFRDRDHGTLNYTVGGRSAAVPLERQVFRVNGITPITDYTDLWWNYRESGWGIGITQQFDMMFVAWFVYDDAGKPIWFVAPECRAQDDGNGCQGKLYRTSGPVGPVAGVPFDPAALRVTEVGTLSVSFTDPANGLLVYTVDGRSALKPITRQTF